MWNNIYEQYEVYKNRAFKYPSSTNSEALRRLLERNRFLAIEINRKTKDAKYHRDRNRAKKGLIVINGNCKFCQGEFKTYDSRVNTCKKHRGMKQWDYNRITAFENRIKGVTNESIRIKR